MTANPLDNPIWESLASRHAWLALRHGQAARYPADVAPFLGLASPHIGPPRPWTHLCHAETRRSCWARRLHGQADG